MEKSVIMINTEKRVTREDALRLISEVYECVIVMRKDLYLKNYNDCSAHADITFALLDDFIARANKAKS